MGIIAKAFENILPYITNIEKMKEFLAEDFDDCEKATKYIQNIINKCEKVTLKTDLRILLNEVIRLCLKRQLK